MSHCPVHRLNKSFLIALQNWKCVHGHTGIEHWSCWERENPPKKKIGYFDIESSALVADFGFCIGWRILDSDNNLYGRVITKEEVLDNKTKIPDIKLMEELVSTLNQFDLLYTYYGCLIPGHKILKKDLTWEKVENLKSGDELLSFDENTEFNGFRKYKLSKVIRNIPIIKECSVIKLSNGDELTASNDHPWLVKRNGYWCWKNTNELIHKNGNNTIQRILPMWDSRENYDSGYLAAFMDGEGNLNQPLRKDREPNEYGFMITFSQKDMTIVNKLCCSLDNLGYDYSVSPYDSKDKEQMAIRLKGGIQEKLRFLGETGCAKNNRLDFDKLQQNRIFEFDEANILSITPIGKTLVMGLETSSATYISNGYGSHNTKFDFPFVRTRCIEGNIKFPNFGTIKHKDVYYIIKNKFKLHRSRLETACEMLLGHSNKTHWMGKHWIGAVQGKEDSLKYIDEHCIYDVKDLKELTEKVLDYANPNTTKSI
jgi:hypothetical protein